MAWFRRKASDEESLDPQVLLRKAEQSEPGLFRMTVTDVFTIRGRGTVVTGTIESGTVTTGQRVRLTRADRSTRDVEVSGVEMFRRVVDTAHSGDNVGLLLRHLDRTDIAAGDVLSA